MRGKKPEPHGVAELSDQVMSGRIIAVAVNVPQAIVVSSRLPKGKRRRVGEVEGRESKVVKVVKIVVPLEP